MKTRIKIKDVAFISLGVVIVVLSCLLFVGCVVYLAIKEPFAFFCALLCGVGFFLVLRDLIEAFYEFYKERNKKNETL